MVFRDGEGPQPPCMPTVLTGNMPAARVGDMTT
jgi:hypothetical protein